MYFVIKPLFYHQHARTITSALHVHGFVVSIEI